MKLCQNCGKPIQSNSRAAKFCSNACRTVAYRKRKGIEPPGFLLKKSKTFLLPDEEREIQRLQLEAGNYEKMVAEVEQQYSKWHRALLMYQTYGRESTGYYYLDSSDVKSQIKTILDSGSCPAWHLVEQEVAQQRQRISELEKELLTRQRRVFRILDGAKAREITKREAPSIVTGSDLVKMKFDVLEFEGKWQELIGNPSQSFYGIVWGDAKAGKSYFSLELAQYLTQFGPVAYIATEEGFSETMRKKVVDVGALDVQILDTREVSQIVKQIDAARFVFIDSATKIDLTPDDVSFLKETFPDIAFIILLQSVKDGANFKGDQRWKHDADFVVEVERVEENRTKASCFGRFGNGSIEYSY